MLCETTNISELCLQEAAAEHMERRRLHRKPFLRCAAITELDGHGISEAAFCRDISRDGIGLMHRTYLERGARFTLTMPMIGRELKVQCETNWCEQVADGHFFSGNAYDYVTTAQSLLLMTAALSQELNRRMHHRFPFVRPASLEDTHGNQHSVYCRDISRGGIGFVHRELLVPGRFTVSLKSVEGAEISGTADLKRCKPLGDGWFASGGRFPLEELEGE
jgi:hypothetical protein